MSFADSDALEKGTWSPYDVLEVSSTATQDEIRLAYKNKMKTFHPDVLKDDDDDGGNKASEINKAYVLLTKEKKRAHPRGVDVRFSKENEWHFLRGRQID